MHLFKRQTNWLDIAFAVTAVILVALIAYAVWLGSMTYATGLLILLLAATILFGYLKAIKIMALKRKFIIVQETFSTIMLVALSLKYFYEQHAAGDKPSVDQDKKKLEQIYEGSRYHLTLPLLFSAIKTFSQIKQAKNVIADEVKKLSTADGFNLENAEKLTKEIDVMIEKLKDLSGIVAGGLGTKQTRAVIKAAVKPQNKKVVHPKARVTKAPMKRKKA